MIRTCGNILSNFGTIHTFIIDDPKYSEPGDQPINDTYQAMHGTMEDTKMYNNVLMIDCKCGYTICEDNVCPFCGRVYHKCTVCGLWYADEDLYDGICNECI